MSGLALVERLFREWRAAFDDWLHAPIIPHIDGHRYESGFSNAGMWQTAGRKGGVVWQ
jgi:hypothetical protein